MVHFVGGLNVVYTSLNNNSHSPGAHVSVSRMNKYFDYEVNNKVTVIFCLTSSCALI